MVSTAVLAIPWLLSEEGIETRINLGSTRDSETVAPLTFHAPLKLTDAAGRVVREAAPSQESAQNTQVAAPPLTLPSPAPLLTLPEPPPPKPAAAAPSLPLSGAPNKGRAESAAPATSSRGWAVRVGTYSKQAGIDQVSALLAEHGFKVHKTRVITALVGQATRIWLGPYADKATALQISRQLESLVGEKGYVTRHVP